MKDLTDFDRYPMGDPDRIPYNLTCSCHPNNGGSGICGCTMANTLVPNPKKYGEPKTNFITATEFTSNQVYSQGNKDNVSYVLNKNINILSNLIDIAEEHSSSSEELIEDAKKWLNELKNK